MINDSQIAVIGDWHLSFVTAACLADAGHKTVMINPFGAWPNFPTCPVHEPGLEEMIQRTRQNKTLDYRNGLEGLQNAKIVWMAVDTPVSEKDEPQVASLIEIAQAVKLNFKLLEVFALSSQVPIGFCQKLEELFGKKVAYIPENLRLGQGIETFARADRTVIGSSTPEIGEKVKALLDTFQTQFLVCNLPTAEMIKHANNAFLATSISFANEIARLGSRFNVDCMVVAKALKLDARIGPKAYVSPGLGFAGGTLPRDLRVLEELGAREGVPTPLMSAVLEVNHSTSQIVAEVVKQNVAASGPRRVLILGYTYKADTDTLRRSLSLEVAKALNESGIECHGFDPFMNGKNLSSLEGCIVHHQNLSDVPSCSILLLMTSRPSFRETGWRQLKRENQQIPLVIDTQGFLRPDVVAAAGLRYRPLWGAEIGN